MVVPLASHRDEIERAIRSASHIWLGLDFDGTLVAYENHPAYVQLPQRSRSLLQLLADHPRMSVAIISGRELEDVFEKVKIDSIAYSGNHGLEIKGRNLTYESEEAAAMQETVSAMSREITKRLKDIAYLLIENKRLSLSVHYRLVAPESWEHLRKTLEEVVREHKSLRLTSGTLVWEVRPSVLASKGTAALWLKEQHAGPNALAIFMGDDVTDEDAFQAFPDGITVVVGARRPSAARYTVNNHEEVHDFLNRIASLVAE